LGDERDTGIRFDSAGEVYKRNVCLDEDSPFHGGLLQYLISHSDTPTSGEIFSDLAVR